MRVPPFQIERWQSVWEHRVELNLAESGVEPLSAAALAGEEGSLDEILSKPLGYPQTNGSDELRSRIAALYPGARADNVLVTNGCAEANFLAVWGLIERDDSVALVQPNYMQISGLVEGFGARARPIWLREELGWSLDPDELRGRVTDDTRLIAVCNPNNPTGSALGESEIDAVADTADRIGAWLLADEVYRGAELRGSMTPTFWGRHERTLCTGGLSKAFGLPGLRIGWIVGPAPVIERLWGHRDYTSISPTSLSDRLAAMALEPEARERILERTRGILGRNYPLVRDWVAGHPERLRLVPPAAGAVAWVGYRGGGSTAELAERLRERRDVLVLPGEQFCVPGFLRIGFGGEAGKLSAALERIGEELTETA